MGFRCSNGRGIRINIDSRLLSRLREVDENGSEVLAARELTLGAFDISSDPLKANQRPG